MPTYVYKFVETGETIEIQQSFTEDTLTEAVHPATGAAMAVKKVFQPVGVTFKGDGFYKTDSRAGTASKSDKSDSAKRSDGAASTNGSNASSDSSSGPSGSGGSNGSSTPTAKPAASSSASSSSSD